MNHIICHADPSALDRLKELAIPSEHFSVPTSGGRVTRTALCTSETDSSVRYADVFGTISPADPNGYPIEWEMLLPLKWNGRSVQVGGGANCGFIPKLHGAPVLSEEIPIDMGFVVYGDDSGHQSDDPMSADFASNQEALDNYIRLHLIKAREAMAYVTKVFYGCTPELCYFIGGSAGGREALECAIHYGKYYDGIFCASPVSSFVLTRMWGAVLSRAVYKNFDPNTNSGSDGFIDEQTVAAIQKDAIARYDALDGIEDGIVSNIFAARSDREAFLAELQAKYHLTEAQLDTIHIYEDGFSLPYSMPNGFSSYQGYSALEGGLMDLGPDPVPREPLDTRYNVHHGDRSDGMFKYFITHDPAWRLLDHDYIHPDDKLYSYLMRASEQYDVNSPDLDEFIAHGGKMILFAAWDDMSISPWQIVEQYKGYLSKYGRDHLDSFCRFFAMPGVQHCYGAKMKYLSWIDQWRTTGSFPEGPLDAEMIKTGGRMPMAPYPGWIHYIGGDPLQSGSYEICYDSFE